MIRWCLLLLLGSLSWTACSGSGEETLDAGTDAGQDAGGDVGPDIWRPAPGTSWQWQLSGSLDTSLDVAMYDIDLFDTPTATIAGLQAAGRVVICYFSAGSWEDWREDADDFPQAAIGKELDGWPGERWLDVRDEGVRDIMRARLDLATSEGCDGVELDNVDGYTNDPGFDFGASDQLDYNRFVADTVCPQANAMNFDALIKNWDLDAWRVACR